MDILTEPMVTLGARIPLLHYKWLIAVAWRHDLTTKDGRPNISAAMRKVLAEAFERTEQRHSRETNNDNG